MGVAAAGRPRHHRGDDGRALLGSRRSGRGSGPLIAYSILNEKPVLKDSVVEITNRGLDASGAPNSPGMPAVRPSAASRPPADPETIFSRVIVVDGASIRAVRDKKPVIIRVAGITVPAFKDTCTDPAGVVWKCGSKGRAELARLIGGRSVACAKLEEVDPLTLSGRCRVGVYDLARWLVDQGWADPVDTADTDLAAAAERAKAAGKGRFGPAPYGVIAG